MNKNTEGCTDKKFENDINLTKVKEKITSNSYIDVTNDWVEKSKGINKKIKIFS